MIDFDTLAVMTNFIKKIKFSFFRFFWISSIFQTESIWLTRIWDKFFVEMQQELYYLIRISKTRIDVTSIRFGIRLLLIVLKNQDLTKVSYKRYFFRFWMEVKIRYGSFNKGSRMTRDLSPTLDYIVKLQVEKISILIFDSVWHFSQHDRKKKKLLTAIVRMKRRENIIS